MQVIRPNRGFLVPLFRRSRKEAEKPAPQPAFEEVSAQEYSLKLSYAAKSSAGVRLKADRDGVGRLTRMLDGYAPSWWNLYQRN